MHPVIHSYDLMGYILGIPLLTYGFLAKRFRGKITRLQVFVIISGAIFLAATIAQNIIEWQK